MTAPSSLLVELAVNDFAREGLVLNRGPGCCGINLPDLKSGLQEKPLPVIATVVGMGPASENLHICGRLKFRAHDRKPRGITRRPGDRHHSLNVGSMHPPQTQGKVQSAVRLALSGMYLLQASARTGLIDCQMTSNVPEEFILPIMTGLER